MEAGETYVCSSGLIAGLPTLAVELAVVKAQPLLGLEVGLRNEHSRAHLVADVLQRDKGAEEARHLLVWRIRVDRLARRARLCAQCYEVIQLSALAAAGRAKDRAQRRVGTEQLLQRAFEVVTPELNDPAARNDFIEPHGRRFGSAGVLRWARRNSTRHFSHSSAPFLIS